MGARAVTQSNNEALIAYNVLKKKIIANGKGVMKPVGLSDAETEDIIAFVRSLKKPSPKQ